jgi:hypothetical protein
VVAYLEKFAEATRADMGARLLNKLPDTLNEELRKAFVKNLLQEIEARGRDRAGRSDAPAEVASEWLFLL